MDFLWFFAVLSAGVAAGAMTGHALLLGRFFNWIFDCNRADAFRVSYLPFIQAKKPQLFFDQVFTVALLVVTVYDVLLLVTHRLGTAPLVAAGLQWIFVLVFFGSGFAAIERELLAQGNILPERVQRFLALNTRITALSAILLLGSFACLLLMGTPK